MSEDNRQKDEYTYQMPTLELRFFSLNTANTTKRTASKAQRMMAVILVGFRSQRYAPIRSTQSVMGLHVAVRHSSVSVSHHSPSDTGILFGVNT